MESFQPKREIKNLEIASLREPIENILEKMRLGLENGSYDAIIGDDASGRIPSLVFQQVITDIYQRKDIEKPQILFIAGAKEAPFEKTTQLFVQYLQEHLRHDPEKTVLLVTEHIETGQSLEALQAALRKLGIKYQIAVLTSQTVPNNEKFLVGKGAGVSSIFHKPELAGVLKNRGEILAHHANHHEAAIKLPANVAGKKVIYSQEDIHDAREDVKCLADQIVQSFK